ncbi:MAG: MotA/TolQ/ExbB proton channel family protein [Planctomycetota bacterium]|nr:MotA/TolQ/ExbB proton channel family protein [Planctomycetota bacterium]
MRWMVAILLAAVMAGPVADLAVATWSDNATPGLVYAQEEGGGGDAAQPAARTWWDSIKAGGAVGAVIILLSIAALALIIQYTIEQKHDKLIPPHVVAELEQLFEEQAYDEAADMCQAEDCFLTAIVGAGLAQLEGGYDAIMKAVDSAGDEETTRQFQKLSNLSLIGAVAPMLGLYGTVTGMIGAFNIIASTAGGASPAQLADGISQALVTTFLGLTVAMPTICCYHFLRNRLIKVNIETGTIVSNLFERFRQPTT